MLEPARGDFVILGNCTRTQQTRGVCNVGLSLLGFRTLVSTLFTNLNALHRIVRGGTSARYQVVV